MSREPAAAVTWSFALPSDREATAPPEARGLPRDAVRLLVATPRRLEHRRFHELPRLLEAGDLVVVNTSALVPSALDARRGDGRPAVVHVARSLDDGAWVVELREPDGHGPQLDGRPGERVSVTGDVRLELRQPYVGGSGPGRVRLWRVEPDPQVALEGHLRRHGRPITYGYLRGDVDAAAFRTIFERAPGSAEMASAGRPFSDAMVTDLVTRGIAVAPVVLHTGVSSPEADEPPAPERFEVPAATAALVEHTRRHGGRVVAVGTTVTRALESAVGPDGRVTAARGETSLVLGPERPARIVDGLVTGWHAPGASHLLLLEAVAGAALVRRAYDAALAGGYLWHEFGDACLLLPERSGVHAVPA